MRSARYRLKWKFLSALFRLPAVVIDSIAAVSDCQQCEPILDELCIPSFAGGADHDDLGVVLRIAKSLRPQLICEIGTAHGTLTANLLRNCADASVVTVNAPAELQSGNNVTYRLTSMEIGRVYRRYGYEQRVLQLLINSLDLDLSQHVKPRSLDLAIIDGCHDTEFVLNDFEKILPFVRPGGVVLFHDTHPSQEGHLAGSYKACLLLRKDGFDVKWIEDTWWGYWKAPLIPRQCSFGVRRSAAQKRQPINNVHLVNCDRPR
jgi:hypothetical protein